MHLIDVCIYIYREREIERKRERGRCKYGSQDADAYV